MQIVVIQGDIADEAADMLVSPDDTGLTMSGGAAAALHEASGDQLRSVAQEYTPLQAGNVAVTPAFDLFADYVVHAAATPFGGATEKTIRQVVDRALSAADERRCQSIVFPLIGGGVGGVDVSAGARIICERVSQWSEEYPSEARLITRSSSRYEDVFEIVENVRASQCRSG